MIVTQPATFASFHGGVTDYYLNGPLHKCRTANNLDIIPWGKIAKLSSRAGSEFYDSDNPQLPPGNQRVGTLKFFEDILLAHTGRKMYWLDSAWTELTGPIGIGQTSGNALFPSTNTVNNVVSLGEWNKHLFVASDGYTRPHKVYVDDSGDIQLRTAGLPTLSDSFVISTGTGATTGAYIYALVLEYTYKVGTVEHKDYGPPVYKQFTNTYITTRTLGTIDSLVNDNTGNVDDNYDTSNIKVGIYRSIDTGLELYKVGEITNGTTTFIDSVTDATLITNETLYVTGGVVDNDPPPACKLLHIVEGTGYFACIKEGTELLTNRLRQSIDGDIDSAPASFYADIDQDIIGLSSAKGTPVLLAEDSAWRIDGKYDELGRGGMIPERISDTASCVSSGSVVQTFEGVFWAGKDGFYYTDGYVCLKLNEDQDRSYAEFVSTAEKARRIQGRYDPVTRRIYWTLQGSGASECDRTAVLFLDRGISKNSSFTFYYNEDDDNFAPTAVEVVDSELIRGDKRGYVFIHKPTLYTDLNIDLTAAPADWYPVAIPYKYESCATNFNDDFNRKFVTWVNVQCKNETDLALQITSNNDDDRLVKDLAIINFNANMVWGNVAEIWGDGTAIWNYQGYIEEMRRFPAGSLRCSYKGLIFKNAYANAYNSDLLGTCDVDSTLKTATLTGASMEWPDGIQGYYLSFTSNPEKQFKIKSHSTNVITFEDTGNQSVDLSSSEWYIKGYLKDQVFSLLSYTMHFAPISKTQDKYQPSESNSLSSS